MADFVSATRKTNGKLAVRLLPSNQLGGEREMLEQVQQGSLELAFQADGAMAGYYPSMQVWSILYRFESAPVAWRVMNSDFADEMRAEILDETGMRALAFSQNGFRSFTNNVRPIVNPETYRPKSARWRATYLWSSSTRSVPPRRRSAVPRC